MSMMILSVNAVPRSSLRAWTAAAVLSLPAALLAAGCGGTSETTAEAQMLVEKYGCPGCHSPTMSAADLSGGNTSLIATFGYNAYGPNLTPDMTTGIGTWTEDQIEEAMLHGKDIHDKDLCAVMPMFGQPCDPTKNTCVPMATADLTKIVAYLKSLDPVHHPVHGSPCTK